MQRRKYIFSKDMTSYLIQLGVQTNKEFEYKFSFKQVSKFSGIRNKFHFNMLIQVKFLP